MSTLIIYTIGHSVRPIDEFIRLIAAHGIECVVDVRTIPRSRHNPQYGQTSLSAALAGAADFSVMRMHGDAVRSILEYCFRRDPPASVRALGSTWSFYRVIEPGEVAIDPANFTFIERVPPEL